jgi:formylglycine-generating enzyme required for sulfatase activity
MVPVEGGAFQMGSRYSAGERPVHTVVVDSFYIGNTEVTQEEWVEVMEDNPSYFKGGLLPVENISWYDAVEYCNKRSLKEGFVPAYQERDDTIVCDFTASGYRLPTEAEWEYAARWGDNRDLSFIYTGEQNVNTVGWFAMNSRESTRPVMTKSPNNLGLYDMSGNVYEWCWDWYENYANAGQENPTGPASGVFRVIRGGGWLSTETGLRFTGRSGEFPAARNNYTGLRVVRRGSAPVEK